MPSGGYGELQAVSVRTDSRWQRYDIKSDARAIVADIEAASKFCIAIHQWSDSLYRDWIVRRQIDPRSIRETESFGLKVIGVEHRDPHEQSYYCVESRPLYRKAFKIVSALIEVGLMLWIARLTMKKGLDLIFDNLEEPASRFDLCSTIGFLLCMCSWGLILSVGFICHIYSWLFSFLSA